MSKRNARDREKHAQESKEEREERLSKRNARDRARGAEKRRTVEQNEPQEKNARRREKHAQESKEEREERLSKRNARDRARRAEKRRTVEQNEPQEKRPRLTLALFLPTFGDCKVQDTLKKFHMEMSTITVAACSTCQESFPGMVMVPRHGECTRCNRDRGTPKLYSEENNMHPGAIPSQLKV